ncbi:glutaredoxin family protein [Bacillus cereus group sp. Bc002]|uniref:glutaredoxin family protein n=1 Tax=Bacillus TaxID=1386 RepID=UPI00034DA09C|nr:MULTISPECIES: glutaredoxin family protein [Bacillus cereus group]ASI76636.1 NrdH-redoxin [Bacillus cereus]MCC2418479.1 glutaredoxin family protein [Bacillus pacificus]MCC2485646.1 glutaredoxin family protein [Bacillus pacificus]MCU5008923.1 glutaredoxin family protein [Bacillus pacificus]MCU5258537.1 glutaredoxin family protein [Bacillus pacificus]
MTKQIILYGHNGCVFCVRAKRWLEENGFEYINKDVTNEEVRTEFEIYNAVGIPLFIIKDNGKQTEEKVVGFKESKLRAILNK